MIENTACSCYWKYAISLLYVSDSENSANFQLHLLTLAYYNREYCYRLNIFIRKVEYLNKWQEDNLIIWILLSHTVQSDHNKKR